MVMIDIYIDDDHDFDLGRRLIPTTAIRCSGAGDHDQDDQDYDDHDNHDDVDVDDDDDDDLDLGRPPTPTTAIHCSGLVMQNPVNA